MQNLQDRNLLLSLVNLKHSILVTSILLSSILYQLKIEQSIGWAIVLLKKSNCYDSVKSISLYGAMVFYISKNMYFETQLTRYNESHSL